MPNGSPVLGSVGPRRSASSNSDLEINRLSRTIRAPEEVTKARLLNVLQAAKVDRLTPTIAPVPNRGQGIAPLVPKYGWSARNSLEYCCEPLVRRLQPDPTP